MQFHLRQRGRAATNFVATLGQVSGGLRQRVDAELDREGLTPERMADDLDERVAQVDVALAESRAYSVTSMLADWGSIHHGRIAHEAFEEVRSELQPQLQRLQHAGPACLYAHPERSLPDYFRDEWIHRTTGGWDGHTWQGFIHGELIHRQYVAQTYPGDIFAQRREVFEELPRQDYRRIVEFGTGTGHYTVQLAGTFPAADFTGVDLSIRMLEQAQRVANELGLPWQLHQVPAEQTGFESESFDLATSYILLHELPAVAVKGVFAEAFRLLEPGGDMLMIDVVRFAALDRRAEWRAYREAIHGGEPYWRESASLDLAKVAHDAGFTAVRSHGRGARQYPWIVYGRKPQRDEA